MTTSLFKPKANWKEIACPVRGARAWRWGLVTVFVGLEPHGWHLSISTPYREPTWVEIRAARYDLVPLDVTMAMLLPPLDEYINIHKFCFHLYQIPNDGEREIERPLVLTPRSGV
jgi:hypothetical protein